MEMSLIRLNLGCGETVIDGWINVDYALGARIRRLPIMGWIVSKLHLFDVSWDNRVLIHDLKKRFPFSDQSVDVIYCSHMFGCFSKTERSFFLSECHRILKMEGVIRVIQPDLKAFVATYMSGRISAEDFLERLCVILPKPEGLLKRVTVGVFSYPYMCVYDEATLAAVLLQAGFSVQSKQAFESDIHDIREIEQEHRVAQGTIILEGTRIA